MSIIKMRGPIDVLFAFKIFSLPVPTRPGTWTFWQVPDPSRPEVKTPYPSDPGYVLDRDIGAPHTILQTFCLCVDCNFMLVSAEYLFTNMQILHFGEEEYQFHLPAHRVGNKAVALNFWKLSIV